MTVTSYSELLPHVGHQTVVVNYADGSNIAIECETCGEVLVDYDAPNTEPTPITIWDLAIHRGAKPADDGTLTGGDFNAVGLDIMGGCCGCGATLSAYNAHPSTSGYWRCKDCIGDLGWPTVEQAELEIIELTKDLYVDHEDPTN